MNRLALALLCLLSPSFSPSFSPAEPTADDRAAVLAAVESELAAISRKDFAAVADAMLEQGTVMSARQRDGTTQVKVENREQVRAWKVAGTITERGFKPTVHLSGPLAVVWLPYDFYLDRNWSHCGVDTFTLLKLAGNWRIASLAYTVEQPPACTAHPAGPPRAE